MSVIDFPSVQAVHFFNRCLCDKSEYQARCVITTSVCLILCPSRGSKPSGRPNTKSKKSPGNASSSPGQDSNSKHVVVVKEEWRGTTSGPLAVVESRGGVVISSAAETPDVEVQRGGCRRHETTTPLSTLSSCSSPVSRTRSSM